MKKNIFILIILALVGLGGAVATANSTWNGTGWISSGNTVSSEQLKGNLDFLYENKAPKPGNCNGSESFLGWVNGGWSCVQKDQPDSCVFNGNTISHGDSVTAYQNGSVPFGQACQSEQRTCTNGVLGGTYQSNSCAPAAANTCIFAGNTISHGDSVTAYVGYSVPFGETCQTQQRTCTNGVLTGTYQAASCAPVAPSACAFGTASVANGDSVTAYAAATVSFGETCQSEVRSCTNGLLSGTYESTSCEVAPAATCVFDGNTLDNGDSVTAYAAATVPFGQSCQSEARTCSDGTLSGSYEATSCEVSRQDPVTFRQSDFVESVSREMCWNIPISITGNAAGYYSARINGGCPGLLSTEVIQTEYYLEGNPGIKYTSRTSGAGPNHDGLASDATTLRSLCQLKGYQYVVGQAPRNTSGFREFTSPGNNRLVYGRSASSFVASGVTINQTFNGQRGYVVCSDSQASPGNGTTTGGGGGGGGETERNLNLF